jgi:surfeit locus 1 family protein
VLALLIRPKFWPGHFAMVVCLAVAVGLGLWQYDAWGQRRADAAKDISNEPAIALSRVMTGDSAFPGRSVGRPVTFSGSWLGDDTVYVSDRYLDGRQGYWVVTPVLVSGADSAMPVVRGWSAKPEVAAPTGAVQVTGWLQATEGNGPFDKDPDDDIIPTMRIASLVEHVDADLYSGYVVARDVSTGGSDVSPVTAASVPKVNGFTALRNLLYAIEWWVFGAFAVFIWVRWCRDTFAESLAEPEDEER